MKKSFRLLIAMLLVPMLVLGAGWNFSNATTVSAACGNPFNVNFLAGQQHNVGTITVWNDANNLYVDINLLDGITMGTVHYYVGTEPPTNSAPGQLRGSAVTPLTSFGDNQTVYIAVHAENVSGELDGEELNGESAWSEGNNFGNSWAMYFEYTIQECTPPPVLTNTSLNLTSMCIEENLADSQTRWRIWNESGVDVSYRYVVYGTDIQGTGTIPSKHTKDARFDDPFYIFINAPHPATVILYWGDNWQFSSTKASSGDICQPPPPVLTNTSLNLTSMCIEENLADSQTRWRIWNESGVDVEYKYVVYGTDIQGTGTIPSKHTKDARFDDPFYIFINAPHPATVILYWGDNWQFSSTKASGGQICSPPIVDKGYVTIKKVIQSGNDADRTDQFAIWMQEVGSTSKFATPVAVSFNGYPEVYTGDYIIWEELGEHANKYAFVSFALNGVTLVPDEDGKYIVSIDWSEVDTYEITVTNRKLINNPPPENPPPENPPPENPTPPTQQTPTTQTQTSTEEVEEIIEVLEEEVPLAPIDTVEEVEEVEEEVEIILEEEVPLAPLPKTGETQPLLFYGFGLLVSALGYKLKRK